MARRGQKIEIGEGAQRLMADQVAIVSQLQDGVMEALERNDSQSVQRLVETLGKSFSTFLEGVQGMGIDVSGLKNVLQSASETQEVLLKLSERIQKLEENSVNPEVINQLKIDVSDIKTALQELNEGLKEGKK